MVMKCGWGPSELAADQRPALAYGRLTNCQKVSGSSSRKQATPKKRASQRSGWASAHCTHQNRTSATIPTTSRGGRYQAMEAEELCALESRLRLLHNPFIIKTHQGG
jgi:hypothetical protein